MQLVALCTFNLVFGIASILLQKYACFHSFVVSAWIAAITFSAPTASPYGLACVTWGATASLAASHSHLLAVLNVVPSIGTWAAELDRRRLARELVLWSSASRAACVRGAVALSRLLMRTSSSDALRLVEEDSFQIVEEALAETRAAVDANVFNLQNYGTSSKPFAVAFAVASNFAAAGLFWHADPFRLTIACVAIGVSGLASRVSAAAITDSDVGVDTAAALLAFDAKPVAWAAATSAAALGSSRITPRIMALCVFHAACATAVATRNPWAVAPLAAAFNIVVFVT